jgi:hypothetical protein
VEHRKERRAGGPGETLAAATHDEWYLAQLRFVDDGRGLVTFGLDANVWVWDLATGEPRHPPLRHRELCEGGDLSPDGRILLTVSRDHTVRFWDVRTGEPAGPTLPHPDWMFGLFSPDGDQVLTGCRDGLARLWDWRAGRLACPPSRHASTLTTAAFTPDGRWVVSAAGDEVRVWDRKTGKPVAPAAAAEGPFVFPWVGGNPPVVVGRMMDAGIGCFGLADLVAADRLGADDLCLLAELMSGRRIHETDVDRLTTEAWLERWRAFRRRQPDLPDLAAVDPGVWNSRLTDRRVAGLKRRAEAMAGDGNRVGAIAAYRRAILLRPDDALARIGLAGILAEAGNSLLQRDKFAEAEPVVRECLAIREEHIPDDWRTFNTRSMLGGSLLGQNRYADAEPLLRAGYEGMARREDSIPQEGQFRVIEALERLARLCESTGRKDEAAKWRRALQSRNGAEGK